MALRDQWVDFYALVALAVIDGGEDEGFVSADGLARVGPWRHKAAASVGKEVARHLAWLEQQGLAHALESRGRTKAWRLALAPAAVELRPTPGEVARWVAGRSTPLMTQASWIEDLERLINATVDLQQGRAESVLEAVRQPLRYEGEPALAAWSALLAGRGAFQHDDGDRLVDVYERWFGRVDAVGRNVGARLRALIAYKNRFPDPTGSLGALRRLAADLELSSDISALASVLNILGMLVGRMESPNAGAVHHLRAAALFGVVGDYPSLQGALFNLATCRRRSLQSEGRQADEATFKLLELCRVICSRFGVGADSALAEIEGARWALEIGDVARARRYLADAEGIVGRIESSYDQACFLVVRAELEYRHPEGDGDPLRDLLAAERLFREVQDERSAAEAHQLGLTITRARQGGGP